MENDFLDRMEDQRREEKSSVRIGGKSWDAHHEASEPQVSVALDALLGVHCTEGP